jgi:ribosomal protein L11 methyltransferase
MLLALVDDFSPTAIEERDGCIRVFFTNPADRDAARFTVVSRFPAAAIDVSDDDWARRSQENLQPITIGCLTIVPDLQSAIPNPIRNPQSAIRNPLRIVIVPSMGFGTGHHATTRLCLEALQTLDLHGLSVLDIGTGSGVLAIAASILGAAQAAGSDNDPDAIQAARENAAHNPEARGLSFEVDDLISTLAARRGGVDVVTANLTGTLLQRAAAQIEDAVRAGGWIVASGILAEEHPAVTAAFSASVVDREWAEDEWVGLLMKKS